MNLAQYIQHNFERGPCTCGKCIDVEEKDQPTGHTANVIFFKVRAKNSANAETLRGLITNHDGIYADVDLFDGEEHGYIELGGWLGDQGLALMLIGGGSLLGLWDLLTPRTVFGSALPEESIKDLAGRGYVTLKVVKK